MVVCVCVCCVYMYMSMCVCVCHVYMTHILWFFPHPVTVQNTKCSNTWSCSPDDGHNDARNMLRYKFDNKHRISCILLVYLSSPYKITLFNFNYGD